MIHLLSNGWVTGWSAKYFSEMFNKTVPDLVQLVLGHWNARIVSREMMNAVLLCQWYKGAAAFTEHCRSNLLHSSTTPVKGAGLAMGLATTDGEEMVLVMFVMGDTGAVVVVRTTRRRLSTSSWNGSCWLILLYSSVLVGYSVKEADSNRWLENNRWVLLWSVESAGSWWRWVISSMNKHVRMMRVMIDVPLFSQELVDRRNGTHTSLSWTLETHTWRSWGTQTME